ncbi:MAG: tetratricopeptide repeat protein [Ignavibacteriales bacterium]|nr:tetratricopeptide repeat protein [Ignavibacteriales bacterium]MBI3789233.1 tetratricopeptide repeat protein [Ignavibacteriales bacterium]
MKRIIAAVGCIALLSIAAQAQSSSVNEIIVEAKKSLYQGYAFNNKQQTLNAYAMLERAASMEPNNRYVVYHLAYAEYLLARTAYVGKDEHTFGQYIDKATERTERLLEHENGWSEASALLGAINGIKISQSPMKGMVLGPETTDMMKEASAADSLNPRVWIVYGTMKLNTPSFFGGSIEDAQKFFARAVALFENTKPTDPRQPEWGYLDALVWLAKSYEKAERPSEALATYKKALTVEPNFLWVKNALLPALEKKMSAK